MRTHMYKRMNRKSKRENGWLLLASCIVEISLRSGPACYALAIISFTSLQHGNTVGKLPNCFRAQVHS